MVPRRHRESNDPALWGRAEELAQKIRRNPGATTALIYQALGKRRPKARPFSAVGENLFWEHVTQEATPYSPHSVPPAHDRALLGYIVRFIMSFGDWPRKSGDLNVMCDEWERDTGERITVPALRARLRSLRYRFRRDYPDLAALFDRLLVAGLRRGALRETTNV